MQIVCEFDIRVISTYFYIEKQMVSSLVVPVLCVPCFVVFVWKLFYFTSGLESSS